MRAKAILCAIVVAHLSLTEAAGQDPKRTGKPETPEAVAARAVDAMREGRIDDFVKLMHPTAVADFKKMMMGIIEMAHKRGEAEELQELFGGGTPEELSKLDDFEFFATFYKNVLAEQPDFKAMAKGAKTTILGHVMEGKDVAHVVHRMTVTTEDLALKKMDVISLRRTKDGWGMLLKSDIEGMIQNLEQIFALDE